MAYHIKALKGMYAQNQKTIQGNAWNWIIVRSSRLKWPGK